ncbi:MAG: InlB B-repeat-containing protein [Clostridia bacterium]|nr:InlB B-repeat-containing protein [Clostridia bacterium]
MKKKNLIIFALAAISAATVTAVGCNKGDGHKHSYSIKSSTTQHWQECDCGDKKNEADHVDLIKNGTATKESDGKCDVCGYQLTVPKPEEKTEYTVTFNMKGHGTAPKVQVVEKGKTATEPATAPTATGYDFKGWFIDDACLHPFDFNVAIDDNTTVYAKWQVKSYTVTFVDHDNIGTMPQALTVDYGGKATKPETDPTATNFTFLGWYSDEAGDNEFDFNTEITGNTQIYAKWEALVEEGQVTVKFNMNGVTGVTNAPSPQVIDENTTATQPATNPSSANYDFGGWYGEAACTTPFDFNAAVSADTTVYAKWTPKTYTVTYNMNGHGTAINPDQVTYNQKVDEPLAPTDTAYSFLGWYDAATGGVRFDFDTPITGDTTLYAHWEAKAVYTVTFDLNGYELWTAPEAQQVVVGNYATKPVTNYPNDNENLVGWSTSQDGTSVFNFNTPVTGNITLYAKWVPKKLPHLEDIELAGSSFEIICENGTQKWENNTTIEITDYLPGDEVDVYTVKHGNTYYTLEIEGTGADVVVTVYDSTHTDVVDTLTKKVTSYPVLSLDGTDIILNNSNRNVKNMYALYYVPASGTYTFELKQTSSNYTIYVYPDYEEDPYTYTSANKGQERDIKLTEGATLAISLIETGGANFSLTFALTEKIHAGDPDGSEDHPFVITGSGSKVIEPTDDPTFQNDYYVVFTATQGGTYHITCSNQDWLNGDNYKVSYTVNDVTNGFVPNGGYDGDYYKDGEFFCNMYDYENLPAYNAAPYATVTLAAGQSVTIIMTRNGQTGGVDSMTCTVEMA